MESDEVKAAVERMRRITAGEHECRVHRMQCLDDARYLTRSDLATLGNAYLALGTRGPDEYVIHTDGAVWGGSTTLSLEQARQTRDHLVRNGYDDAKIVRVVSFALEIQE